MEDRIARAMAMDAASGGGGGGDGYSKAETDALLAGKVDKVSGKGLSTEDYTTAEKSKLAGIASGAEVNVQADWSQSDSSADDYIKNKPTLGTAAALDMDAALNGSSVNPVQNKAVKAETDKLVAGLAEAFGSGAKNLLKINASSAVIQGVSFTVNTDGTVSASGTNTGSSSATLIIVPNADAVKIPDGDYVLSGCPAGGSSDTFDLRWFRYSTNKSAYDTGASAEVSKSGNTNDSNIAIVVKAGATINATFAPMLCAKAAWDVSQAFEQYAPTNRELYAMIQALQAGM